MARLCRVARSAAAGVHVLDHGELLIVTLGAGVCAEYRLQQAYAHESNSSIVSN